MRWKIHWQSFHSKRSLRSLPDSSLRLIPYDEKGSLLVSRKIPIESKSVTTEMDSAIAQWFSTLKSRVPGSHPVQTGPSLGMSLGIGVFRSMLWHTIAKWFHQPSPNPLFYRWKKRDSKKSGNFHKIRYLGAEPSPTVSGLLVQCSSQSIIPLLILFVQICSQKQQGHVGPILVMSGPPTQRMCSFPATPEGRLSFLCPE